MEAAEIRYAKCDGAYIAYEVRGDGPIDLLALNSGCHVWIDRDDEPHWSRFDRRLASFCRLIRFDPSGVGLSDPLARGEVPTLDLWVEDARSVLDAVGSSRAAVFGVSIGGFVSLLLCATHPERVSAQVLMHCSARLVRDADSPWGVPERLLNYWIEAVPDPTYQGARVDDAALSAPTLAENDEFRSWWRRAGERIASPAVARAMDVLIARADLRAVLPSISAPTLVLHRVDNAFWRIGHSRDLAERISGARLIELPGQDHLPFAGETEALLGEVEEFLTGSRAQPSTDRVLTTVLFTDIVRSTERAATAGDRRWRELLDDHDRMAARQVHRFGGRQVKSTGDGILATFASPARAIECGLAMCAGARQLGVEMRVGIHTGEVERRGDDIAGMSVHIAARIEANAEPGEVWVSRTVADLMTGSSIAFSDRGERVLKGVPGSWRLLAVDG